EGSGVIVNAAGDDAALPETEVLVVDIRAGDGDRGDRAGGGRVEGPGGGNDGRCVHRGIRDDDTVVAVGHVLEGELTVAGGHLDGAQHLVGAEGETAVVDGV